MARAELHRKGIAPKVSLGGPCAQQIKKMNITHPGTKKKGLVIHRVHPEHMACAAFVKLTNAHTGGTLMYTGEGRGAIMNKAFEEEMIFLMHSKSLAGGSVVVVKIARSCTRLPAPRTKDQP